MHKGQFCVLAAPLFSASLQEEKLGLQKGASSEESGTKGPLNQDVWEAIPLNTLWIKKKKTGTITITF